MASNKKPRKPYRGAQNAAASRLQMIRKYGTPADSSILLSVTPDAAGYPVARDIERGQIARAGDDLEGGMKTVYLTKEETDALLRPQAGPDWRRMALAMADVIEAAWTELPADLRATRGEQGASLAGAINALRLRSGR